MKYKRLWPLLGIFQVPSQFHSHPREIFPQFLDPWIGCELRCIRQLAKNLSETKAEVAKAWRAARPAWLGRLPARLWKRKL